MDFKDQLETIKIAGGNVAKLALVNIDLSLEGLPAEKRDRIRSALIAATTVHWFDEKILAALLTVSEAEATDLMVRLRELTVVESFSAHGLGAGNIHDEIRRALIRLLVDESPELLRTFTLHALQHFAKEASRDSALSTSENPREFIKVVYDGNGYMLQIDRAIFESFGLGVRNPHNVIETCYHLFFAHAANAVNLCDKIFDQLHSEGNYQGLLLLARMLEEMLTIGIPVVPAGKIHSYLLLTIAKVRYWYRRVGDNLQPAADLAQQAVNALEKEVKPNGADAAREILGEILIEMGQFEAGYLEFDRLFESRRAEISPETSDLVEANWLTVAYNRRAESFTYHGDPVRALECYQQALQIRERLIVSTPNDRELLRSLRVSHSYVGKTLEQLNRRSEALEHYQEGLAISQNLIDLEPRNLRWQADLSRSFDNIGSLVILDGRFDLALAAFQSHLFLAEELARVDPLDAKLQWSVATAMGRIAMVLVQHPTRPDKAEAKRMIEQALTIMETLSKTHALTPDEQETKEWLLRWESRANYESKG